MEKKKFNSNKLKSILYKIFIGTSAARKILSFYIYACLLGSILLLMPFSLNRGVAAYHSDGTSPVYTAFEAVFIAISAFTDTGLSPIVISDMYNAFGQVVILLLIQLGGLGMFAVFWLLWSLIFNNKIYKKKKGLALDQPVHYGFSNTLVLVSERGDSKIGLSLKSIKIALIFIFLVEIIFAFIYSGLFYSIKAYEQVPILPADVASENFNGVLSPADYGLLSNLYTNGAAYVPYYHNYGLALWTGIFHSVSSMNNAGFDIFGPNSLGIYRNDLGTIVQYLTILEFVLGGIGYPVIYDVYEAINCKIHCRHFRFSLFTKTSILTYFIVGAIGLVFSFSFEFGVSGGLINQVDTILNHLNANKDSLGVVDTHIYDKLQNYYGDAATWNKITSVAFGSLSTRSAGFATVNQSALTDATKWVYISLMFVGCAPSSTGGGIRTTTLAVIFMALIARMKGNNNTRLFNRWIPKQTVVDSFIIFTVSASLITLFVLINYPIINSINTNYSVTDIFFEFASAFGTVGLSSGVTGLLNDYSFSSFVTMFFLCNTMIIGQLGVTTTIFMFRNSKKSSRTYDLAYENIKTC